MDSVLGVVLLVAYIVTVLLIALRIPRNQLSSFELERRMTIGDPQAIFGAKRQAAYDGIVALRWLVGLLVGLATLLLTHLLFAKGVGVLISIIEIVALGPLARLGLARRLAQRLYRKYELRIVQFVNRTKFLWRLLSPPGDVISHGGAPSSREELLHLIESSRMVVTPDEITSLKHTLHFYRQTAEQVMTAASQLVVVPVDEVLGPLVINDLHASGHAIFPVVQGAEYVGLLDISGFTALRHHDSPLVRDEMRTDILKARYDEPLDELLKLFVDTKQVCLFVTDDDDSIVGMISLSDIVHALTGWKRRN